MDAADAMILASPVYVDDVNGIAKVALARLAGAGVFRLLT
jgi:multimeric flavodoxin WrbA